MNMKSMAFLTVGLALLLVGLVVSPRILTGSDKPLGHAIAGNPSPAPSAPVNPVAAAAQATRALQEAQAELKASSDRLVVILAAIKRRPKLDSAKEGERLAALKDYVEGLMAMGTGWPPPTPAYFEEVYAKFIKATAAAEAAYTGAAAHLRQLADNTQSATLKEHYDQMARWYEARANYQHEMIVSTTPPQP